MPPRAIDLLVLSDLHLGTFGCHATELVQYLHSIQPKIVVLNGDIIDVWNFNKNYFPPEHWLVIERVIDWASKGVKVHYITGNHDEIMRRFVPMRLANFELEDKVLLQIDGQQVWIFHGDVFDVSIKISKTLARLGGKGYDWLIWGNRLVNTLLGYLGKPPMSFSKKVKDSIKRAVKYIDDFEQTAAELAIEKGYDYVVCGHIHQPQMRTISTAAGSVTYLNSGDWVENLSSLEYYDHAWHLYYYTQDENTPTQTPIAPPQQLPSYEKLVSRITAL